MPLTFNIIFTTISIMVSVAFYTMLERKILGYIQIRKGPNKTSIVGILQPFSDAIKLFNKNIPITTTSNLKMAIITPLLALSLVMLMLLAIPTQTMPPLDLQHNTLVILFMSSLSVYPIMFMGWATNSKYSNIGALRSIAQMISYEVSLFLILFFLLMMFHSYNTIHFKMHQTIIWSLWLTAPIFMMWLITCLAETNRSPFDFAEGESELVSGFNVEYSGGLFALIFIAEYMSMIILSMFTTIMFISPNFISQMMVILMITMWFIVMRGTLPRFRFDLLMNMNWKIFLPTTLIMAHFTTFMSMHQF